MSFTKKLGTLLRNTKDSAASAVAEKFIQKQISRYGDMLNLSIDSTSKKLQVELMPKGEKEPLAVNIQRYEIVTEGAETFMIIRQATASREWVETAIQDFVVGKKLPVPAQYANMIKMVL